MLGGEEAIVAMAALYSELLTARCQDGRYVRETLNCNDLEY
jgi:hypothetical protein